MKRYTIFRAVQLLVFGLALLIAIEPCYAQKKNGNKKGSKRAIPSVCVYLDNTSSMEGYQLATNPNVFTGVFAAISQHYSASTIQGRIVKSNTISPIDYNGLMNGLTNRNIPFTDSYQLEELFKDMVSQVKKSENAICFLVTDGIPSGTNAQLKKNPNFNIQNTAILSANIASALKPLQQGSYEVGVFRFVSGFKGNYYKFNNSKVFLNDVQRPFYVIAIGPKNLVEELYKSSIKSFIPTNKTKYGVGNHISIVPKELKYLVLDKKIGKNQTKVKLTKKTETITFVIKGLSRTIPASAITVLHKGKPVTIRNNEFNLDLTKGRKANINIKINNVHAKWVSGSSSSDDSGISNSDKSQCGQTFNLIALVDGIMQGIDPKGNNSYIFNGGWDIIN